LVLSSIAFIANDKITHNISKQAALWLEIGQNFVFLKNPFNFVAQKKSKRQNYTAFNN